VGHAPDNKPLTTPNQPGQFEFEPFTEPVVEQIRQELPRLVWHSAGICRDAATMTAAIAQIETWREQFAALPLSQAIQNLKVNSTVQLHHPEQVALLRQWAETQNLLDVAYLILKSANYRTESRGGHYRQDFPETDPAWEVHTVVQGDRWWQVSVDAPTPISVSG